MDTPSYVSNGNAAYISALYEDYQKDPESIEFGWRKFFEGFDFGKSATDAINEVAGNTLHSKMKKLSISKADYFQ